MYILTDGHFFVAQNKNDCNKYNAVITREEATLFTYRQAKILMSTKKSRLRWIVKGGYKIINEDDGKEISPNYEGKADIYVGENNIPELSENIVDDIISKVQALINIEGVDKVSLEKQKEILNNMLSYYDSALSDIHHIIRDCSPNAAIRNKIYSIAHSLENKRERVKTCLRYIQVLLDGLVNNYNISTLKEKLNDESKGIYKGRTDYFEQIMSLINKKKGNNENE